MFGKKKQNDHIPSDDDKGLDINGTFSPIKQEFIDEIKKITHSPADLIIKEVTESIVIAFIENLVDKRILEEHLITVVEHTEPITPTELQRILPIPRLKLTEQKKEIIYDMLAGTVIIYIDGYCEVGLANIASIQNRSLSAPENESQVIGSQVGFNESLGTNVSLVRSFIRNPNLCIEEFSVGKQTNTVFSMIYVNSIASEQNIRIVRERINNLNINDLIDSAMLAELIEDNSYSIFPQMLLTERPDRFCDGLLNGKIGIIVNGSSMAILCPTSFLEFFHSREEQNLRWQLATFIRLLRFNAVFLSIYLTPLYVASLTFHYEIIPQPLLVPLSESRAIVPFPPIIEALILELIIELLREAGARLPTKVGQTIGIVGGIVIGTAAVQAGITSNILIIIIALCALASFTTPNYMMGNVIRLLRFPIIFLAGFWGYYGIMLSLCLLIIHLLRQSSLGAPYLSPLYPPRILDWGTAIIRLPIGLLKTRATSNGTFNREVMQEKDKPQRDDVMKE
ncbi:spore germination protein [Lysinibacillus odysseyi]|uniref:spore germination protein n=1 Tax=Lysinibacillus odysseyi TaxID=202611 RepID=UPI000689F676|nr:spore germination protein [Lysinibacillus odysseyi]